MGKRLNNQCKRWKKDTIDSYNGNKRYEYTCGDFTIDVHTDKRQGYAGSNQVNIFGGKRYGGWILNTPKNFSNKRQMNAFIKQSKKKLEKGEMGKKVPFPP